MADSIPAPLTPMPPGLVDDVKSQLQTWLGNQPHWVHVLIALAFTCLGFAVRHYWPTAAPVVAALQMAQAPAGAGDGPRPMGWVDNPEQVEQVVAMLRHPVFRDTPAGQAADIPDRAYLWQIEKTARAGVFIPARDQKQVGACTAFGGCRVIECAQCVQIVTALKSGRPPPAFADLAQEATYGIARVNVLGGQLRGEDGATGAAVAQASRDYGVAPRGKYAGGIDLTSYSEAACRKYGDDGVPAAVMTEAKRHLVKSISPVRTTDELRHSLASSYGVSVASNVGFGNRGPYVRDKDGVLKPSGTWPHQMCFLGYTNHQTRGWLYFVMNSWGPDWVSGPPGAGDPPPGGFWVTEAAAQKMLNARDSWSFADVDGFAARQLDWASTPTPHRRDLFGLNYRGLTFPALQDIANCPGERGTSVP